MAQKMGKLLKTLSLSNAALYQSKNGKARRVTLHGKGVTGDTVSVAAIKEEFELSFLGVDGSIRKRKALLVLPAEQALPCPVVISLHYELPLNDQTTAAYVQEGFAVLTPIQIPSDDIENIVGNDFRFSMALVAWARRQKTIVGDAMAIRGASAGGHHVLQLSAFVLGLCCAYSMSGVCNLAYNLGRYIPEADKVNEMAKASLPKKDQNDLMKYPLPFVRSVALTFQKTCQALGAENPESPGWVDASPVTHANAITQPVLFSHSTADLIVPVHQITNRYAPSLLASDLPEGYRMGLCELMVNPVLAKPLDEVLDRDAQAVFTHPVPQEGQAIPLRHDPDKRFHFNYIDEGAPECSCSHFKHQRSGLVNDVGFLKAQFALGAKNTNTVKEEKLHLLALRYHGLLPFTQHGKADDELPPQVLGSAQNNQLDVLLEVLTWLGIGVFDEDVSGDGLDERTAELTASLSRLPGKLQFLDPRADQFLKQLNSSIEILAASCGQTEIARCAASRIERK